jgi:hypothetical protein
MSANLVLGFCDDGMFEKITPFIASMFERRIDCDLCLFSNGMDERLVAQAARLGFRLEDAKPFIKPGQHPLNARFAMYQSYLWACSGRYAQVLLTEPGQAMFLADPFALAREAPVYVAVGDLPIREDAQRACALAEVYGPAVLEAIGGHEMSRAGTVIGTLAGVEAYLAYLSYAVATGTFDHAKDYSQAVHDYILWHVRPDFARADLAHRLAGALDLGAAGAARPARAMAPEMAPGAAAKPRKNLIILRCGPESLHPAWIDPGQERSFDIYLSPFREDAVEAGGEYLLGAVVPGQKWRGMAQVLEDWRGWRDYEYVWLPDDDLAMSQQDIEAFFRLCHAHDAWIAAPALGAESYASHLISMKNEAFIWRRVTFIEIMMPCFKASLLAELAGTLALSPSGLGWGLDLLWAQKIGYQNMLVFDAVEVRHTRPVGGMRDAQTHAAAWGELESIIAAWNIPQIVKVTGGMLKDGRSVGEADAAFLPALLSGYQYAIERHPDWFATLMHRQGWRRNG